MPFPFTNLLGSKQRPAVVFSSRTFNEMRRDVLLMAVTGRFGNPIHEGQLMLSNWNAAGLVKQSAIKPIMLSLEQNLVRRKLGRLAEADGLALRSFIFSILG